MMRRYFFLLLTLVVSFSGCSSYQPQISTGTVPSQIDTVSAEDEEYGHKVLSTLVEQYPLDYSNNSVSTARDVVNRLAVAAKSDHNPWHVYVLKGDDVKNAAATRGNYIFIWTGLLNVIQNEEELATILAHEISHVLAGHTLPDPSEEAKAILGEIAGTVAKEILYRQGSAGAVIQLSEVLVKETVNALVLNPIQQGKELEADSIGLFLMADAGYNPESALNFWNRVSNDPDFGSGSFGFLSSHPSSEERLKQLRALLPESIARYQVAKGIKTKSTDLLSSGSNQDSFARSNNSKPRITTDSFARPTIKRKIGSTDFRRRNYWIAQESSISVYSEPSLSSSVISRLDYGTKVKVDREFHRWLKISSPQSGYVQSFQFSPTN